MARTRAGRRRTAKKRYPNGKPTEPSEAQRIKEMRSVVESARIRALGVSKSLVHRPESATAFGRLHLSGEISVDQYSAGEEYAKVVHRYERALLVKGVGSAGDLDRTHGFDASGGDDPDYIAECQAAQRAYREARRTLLEAAPFALHVVDACVLEDKQLTSFVGDLRTGLNALARLYRVEEWRRRA